MTRVAISFVAVFVLAIIAGGQQTGSSIAFACTPGPPLHPLEEIALADAIAVVRVASVQGSVNPAPTVTPKAVSPPVSTTPGSIIDGMPDDFDLSGYGARLVVERVHAGSLPAEFDVDSIRRAQLEERVRIYEGGGGSNCPVSDPRVRYLEDGLYLAFLDVTDSGVETVARFMMNGSAIVVGSELGSESTPLYLTPEHAEAFFPRAPFVKFEGQSLGQMTGPVATDLLLGAIASLRGDTTIRPPDAGNAGLKR
jgi:hypothetical protein